MIRGYSLKPVMSTNNHIQQELRELGSNLQAAPVTPYGVPAGYFEGFAERMLARVQGGSEAAEELQELSPFLASLPKSMPYAVPDQYLTSNEASLPAFTADEDSVVLSAIGKEMPYTVPQGYFENLPDALLRKAGLKEAKVVRMNPARNWMKLAVAAMVAGIITISGIVYMINRQDVAVDSPQWVSMQLKIVSDSELDRFLKSTPVGTASKTTAVGEEVEEFLDEVSDAELETFLAQVPSEDELAIN